MTDCVRIRSAVLLLEEGCLLLVRHQKDGRSYWLLPGGGVEFGEAAPEAARRETFEETGLRVEIGPLALVAETIAPDASRHVLHLVFQARRTGGELSVGQEDRLVEARFVPLLDVDHLALHPPLAPALRELLGGVAGEARYLGRLWVD